MRSFKTFGSKLLKTALHYIEDIILDQCRKRTSILPVFFFILKKLFSEKCLLGEKQRLSLFVKIQRGVLLGCLVCWLVGSQFQNSSNWNAFAIDMPLEVAAYFRCGIKTYIWQISISKFESIFQVFWEEMVVKGKNVLILNAAGPFPACQGTRGLKGNGRSATLGTESETRPPGQNILTLYCVLSIFERNTLLEYCSEIWTNGHLAQNIFTLVLCLIRF